MRQDLTSTTSDTYELKFQTFENVKPEYFLQMMKDFKTGIDGTATTSATRKIQFLRTMLRRGALRGFDVIAGQVGSTNNTHLQQIKEGLLSYFTPLNALNKKKRAMRCAMRKPRDVHLKRFAAQLR